MSISLRSPSDLPPSSDLQTQILTASMLADVVDDAEAKTGRRTEGMLFGLQSNEARSKLVRPLSKLRELLRALRAPVSP